MHVGRKRFQKYTELLNDHQVFFIKVNCELQIMEEREKTRGDRVLGLSRAQYSHMKNEALNSYYHFQVDTSRTEPVTNAKKILEFVKKN